MNDIIKILQQYPEHTEVALRITNNLIPFINSLNKNISGIDGKRKYSLTKRSHHIIAEIEDDINNIRRANFHE